MPQHLGLISFFDFSQHLIASTLNKKEISNQLNLMRGNKVTRLSIKRCPDPLATTQVLGAQ